MDHNETIPSAQSHERWGNPFATALSMSGYWGSEALEVASSYLYSARMDGRSEASAFWVRVCVSITQQRLRRILNALPTVVEFPMACC